MGTKETNIIFPKSMFDPVNNKFYVFKEFSSYDYLFTIQSRYDYDSL